MFGLKRLSVAGRRLPIRVQQNISRRHLLATGGVATAGALAAATLPTGPAVAVEPEVDPSFADFTIPMGGCDNSLLKVQQRGELIVGCGNDWPFSYLAPNTNAFSGIDADIIRFICKMLKIPKITVMLDAFDGLIPGLLDGRFDMIGESLHWTPKRAKVVGFSFPTYYYGDAVALKSGSPLSDIHTLEDLKGHKVGTQLGSNYAEWLGKIPEIQLVATKDGVQLVRDVSLGRIDAVLWDTPSLAAVLKEHPDWNIEIAKSYQPHTPKTPVTYGVLPFRQADVQLQGAFSAALQWMQTSQDMAKIIAAAGLPVSSN